MTTEPRRPGLSTAGAALALPLAYMAGIYLLSSIPGTAQPDDPAVFSVFVWLPPAVQNTLHIPLFGGLAWLWRRALGLWLDRAGAATSIALVITVLYGVMDEWHQMGVPGRYASLTDILLDTLGALAALWLYRRVRVGTAERRQV